MDKQTADYYKKRALQISEQYDISTEGVSKYFELSFPKHAKVLDIGTGSGWDLYKLIQLGYDAYGLEPCMEFRELVASRYPELGNRLWEGSLPALSDFIDCKFDGILCSAVLMHVPKEQLFDSAFSIRNILNVNGRLLISIPDKRPDLDENGRDKGGRLFNLYPPEYLQLLFERIGFQMIGKWTDPDSLNRLGYSWNVLLFELKTSQTVRPIDQIEGILNRDRKVATYKLALFRALCDIAMTSYQRVDWEDGGEVSVPIIDVVEKWVYYYWPIIESGKFLPQIRGEAENSRTSIAFRIHLSNLINYYRNIGGLSRFTLDFRNAAINEGIRPLINDVFKSIRIALVNGPVTYAGGSLETGRIFMYDKRKKAIRFSADLWREISLMGHWINDAIILRWAELTTEISKKEVKASEIIDLLLITPIQERDVYDVRDIYLKTNVNECVWSGKKLSNHFDVDHVLPFSLWRNNDMWNLLPADPKVNRKKSDKLPTRCLLSRRKDQIIHYWQILRSVSNSRFDYEASKILAKNATNQAGWESNLFSFIICQFSN